MASDPIGTGTPACSNGCAAAAHAGVGVCACSGFHPRPAAKLATLYPVADAFPISGCGSDAHVASGGSFIDAIFLAEFTITTVVGYARVYSGVIPVADAIHSVVIATPAPTLPAVIRPSRISPTHNFLCRMWDHRNTRKSDMRSSRSQIGTAVDNTTCGSKCGWGRCSRH